MRPNSKLGPGFFAQDTQALLQQRLEVTDNLGDGCALTPQAVFSQLEGQVQIFFIFAGMRLKKGA